MTNKIFKSVLAAVVTVLLVCAVLLSGILYSHFSAVQQLRLKDELVLAAEAAEKIGLEYFEALPSSQYRFSWISADGEVIYDSRSNVSDMENHAGREEIKEAFATGSGSSKRYSATLLEQSFYEAVLLDNGTVLRISVNRASIIMMLLALLQPMAIIFFAAVGVSALFAHRISKWIVRPLNDLDLDNPMDNEAYDELAPLLRRINYQQAEIKKQMHRLQRSKDEFEQISGSMKEALVLLDSECKIVSINPAALALFGVDSSCVGEDILSVERSLNMRRAVYEAQKKAHSAFNASMNGREYHFDLSRIESESKVHGLVILGLDVTERAEAERIRREFTANVSHELKTPLQTIIGSAELMKNNLVKQEDIPRFVTHIHREASNLLGLIDDIIRLSQMDEGVDLAHEEVSLLDVARQACEALEASAEKNSVTLEAEGDEGVICGVRSLLYEAVYNLCDNAIKYNIPGGNVKITVSEKGDTICLEVEDSGIGIAAEHQEKIFERFYRVDKSRSRQSGGTGLGLSIVKHAVQYHGGRIEIKSEQGKGTRFLLFFDKHHRLVP